MAGSGHGVALEYARGTRDPLEVVARANSDRCRGFGRRGGACGGRVAGVRQTGAPVVKLTGVRLWGDLRNMAKLPGIPYGTAASGAGPGHGAAARLNYDGEIYKE